jgi:ribonuclease HI
MLTKRLDIYTDGACSGNPGMGGIGVVIKDQGKVVKELSQSLDQTTNNLAEYTAVIYALQEALIFRADVVAIHTDSELLFRQVKGEYKVINPNIKPLFEQIRHLAKGFKGLTFKHIPRQQNREADSLAKRAIKKEQAKVVASEFNFGEESPSSQG